MSKKRDTKLYLEDILEEIKRIQRFAENTKNFEEFSKNDLVLYAVLKSLENIGEAVKNIPEEIKQFHSIEWKKIAGFRDVLIHDYFGIDIEIVWEVIQHKLPELESAIRSILKELEER
ncbi:MAG: DUF86 domain-containing protein [Candidatus Omnitrophica bacterium]|nr:DUF86 domain-containing protein [Candidatus Omnitrophota bacterium]